ncbi:putative two-component histidine kinase [Agrobacterium rubi TR3 = NBRC 13261]|uniref:histidine kinase n=1 Tax=Agrobacterium rubi TR3 = NBRC 13261 TaxID=1368415 RepID=A0A081D246_9HYPH|nr:HAMP domain-containing sensor histidine kinase [Agrobacterium rubi]MBP1881019.1 signal transduction histidine kinase [Agrobacterium rubi]MCL6653740.1 histidine kinase [Agrobacterium rubi]GAK72992.1 putative two-component histidine kinase [Agrobacterium rubi TR3 = NBRC 13261]
MVRKLRIPHSLAGRLLLFSGLFVTVTLVVASVILWLALKNVVREQIDQRLDTQIGALASTVTRTPSGHLELSTPLDAPPFDRRDSGWYWQIETGRDRLTSLSLAGNELDGPKGRKSLRETVTGLPSPGDAEDLHGKTLYTRQVTRNIDGEIVTITATAPFGALVDPAIRALFWLIPCMLFLGLVLLAGTLWQIRFGLKPLASMAADIDAINRGDIDRLPPQKSPELSPLTEKTNALLIANEERLTATRMQFANLAHGLKTPVASLMLALDDGNDTDGTLRNLAKRIDQRIKHHLNSARHAMVSTGNVASANIAASVADLHLAIGSIHAERGISFEIAIDETLKAACSENDLEEMLGNLIDNAFKWASSHVKISAQREGSVVRITIEDDGPGIPEDRMEAVLLPGVREDERVAGTGFGLSIVSELSGLYGGSLSLHPNEPAGLRAILALPISTRTGP